jgi:hypothetical protein
MANRLREFEDILLELCQASIATSERSGAAPACGKLIADVVAQGRAQFVDQHTQTPGPNDIRLNGAGLKLEYEVESYRDGDEVRVYVAKLKLGGDQVADYPAFVRAAQPILQSANGTASVGGVTRLAG